MASARYTVYDELARNPSGSVVHARGLAGGHRREWAAAVVLRPGDPSRKSLGPREAALTI